MQLALTGAKTRHLKRAPEGNVQVDHMGRSHAVPEMPHRALQPVCRLLGTPQLRPGLLVCAARSPLLVQQLPSALRQLRVALRQLLHGGELRRIVRKQHRHLPRRHLAVLPAHSRSSVMGCLCLTVSSAFQRVSNSSERPHDSRQQSFAMAMKTAFQPALNGLCHHHHHPSNAQRKAGQRLEAGMVRANPTGLPRHDEHTHVHMHRHMHMHMHMHLHLNMCASAHMNMSMHMHTHLDDSTLYAHNAHRCPNPPIMAYLLDVAPCRC